jgi:hypothetical protein
MASIAIALAITTYRCDAIARQGEQPPGLRHTHLKR